MKKLVLLLLLAVGSNVASADSLTINEAKHERHAAWGANIGVVGQQIVPDSVFVAWVDAEEGEYRNLIQFDVRPSELGFDSSDVTSATLKWSTSPWQIGRHSVTVDQVDSVLSGTSTNYMYGHTLAGGVFTNGWVDTNSVVDITAAFKAAMDGATANKGIAYRWHNDNDADPTAPYDATPDGGTNWVVFDAGLNLGAVTIKVEYDLPFNQATINKAKHERHGAWGANIGVAGQQIVANNGFTAWNAGEEGEYRNLIQFDVRSSELGFNSSDVVSATLEWTHSAWGAGRSAVTIDQTDSVLSGTAFAYMYGHTVASGIFTNGGTASGSGSVDITAAFVAAMDGATANKGIAYRWHNDNDADPTAPYDATPDGGTNWVVLDTGFNLINATIVVDWLPPANVLTVSPGRKMRYGAFGANIYSVATQALTNNPFVAFVDAEESEYRYVVNFDVRPSELGITSINVAKATLKWGATSFGAGRNAVTVDQIVSDLATDQYAYMYGNTLASAVFSNGWVVGNGEVDVTAAFKAAMDGATATGGIAYRWYNDNDADPTAPYTGSGSDWVVLDTGFNLVDPIIEVEYVFPTSARIIGISPTSDPNIMKVVVHVEDLPAMDYPQSTADLTSPAWDFVPHSYTNDPLTFVPVTNLEYSVADESGTNRVIYVEVGGDQGFFRIFSTD